MFRRNSQYVAQDHQRELTIEAWKWLLLLLKPKWYLDIKLEAFYQFSSNDSRKQCVLFCLESFLLISGISLFLFLPYSIFKNLETTENFQMLIFWGIKSTYLISSTFLSIVCSQLNSQGVAQSYQGALIIKAWNWLFVLLKPKRYKIIN